MAKKNKFFLKGTVKQCQFHWLPVKDSNYCLTNSYMKHETSRAQKFLTAYVQRKVEMSDSIDYGCNFDPRQLNYSQTWPIIERSYLKAKNLILGA